MVFFVCFIFVKVLKILVVIVFDNVMGFFWLAVSVVFLGDIIFFDLVLDGVFVIFVGSEVIIDKFLIIVGNGFVNIVISVNNFSWIFNILSGVFVVI